MISIAFNIPPVEAPQGLIALFEFWYKALWRRTQTVQTTTNP